MEANKIKNIKEREKFIEFKDFKQKHGTTRRIKLSSITQYFVEKETLMIKLDTELIKLTYPDQERAIKLIEKLDTFFHISKI